MSVGFAQGAAGPGAAILTELQLSHYMLEDDISSYLGSFSNLEHLDLSRTEVGSACFASAVTELAHLSCLILVNCDLLCNCPFRLLKRTGSPLRHLDLRGSGYAGMDLDRGVEALKSVFGEVPLLTVRYSAPVFDDTEQRTIDQHFIQHSSSANAGINENDDTT